MKIFAKSKNKNNFQLELRQHCIDTANVANLIFTPDKNFYNQFCKFFKFSNEEKYKFLLNLKTACLFHDIGKSWEEFQNMINYKNNDKVIQRIRHEHMSLIIMYAVGFLKYFHPSIDNLAIISAVGSHHLKLANPNTQNLRESIDEKFKIAPILKSKNINIYKHEINNILKDINFLIGSNFEFNYDVLNQKDYKVIARHIYDTNNIESSNFLSALKASLIFCDTIASISKSDKMNFSSIEEWVENSFFKEIINATEIDDIINHYTKKRSNFKWHSFQEGVDSLPDKVLMMAPCGMGKTLASFRWAKKVAERNKKENILFLLPTRGTATEIHKNYIAPVPILDSILKHGTDKYSLMQLETSLDDEDLKDKYHALNIYKNKIFTATVDQFLSFLANDYGSICLLPLLTNSIIIIDEIHAFDDVMFNHLYDFITHYDVPIMCMSATVDEVSRRRLKKIGLQIYEGSNEELENKEKYCIEICENYSDFDYKSILDHKKVLIVLNTVKQCQKIVQEMNEFKNHGYEVICYHSKFKLKDREEIHRKVIDLFEKDTKLIVVCTQVCEMSLDIDCDLLITQAAPWAALVQRFGRCNRHNKIQTGRIVVINSSVLENNKSYLPYNKTEIDNSIKILKENKITTQRHLSEQIKKMASFTKSNKETMQEKSFINQTYGALRGSFRDDSVKSIDCILNSDIENIKSCIGKKPIDGFVISVSSLDLKKIEVLYEAYNYSVIDSKNYDDFLGLVLNE